MSYKALYSLKKTILFVKTTKLFISNNVRTLYLYVPGVGPLNSLFCTGEGFFVHNDCQGGGVTPSSSVPGVRPGGDGFG